MRVHFAILGLMVVVSACDSERRAPGNDTSTQRQAEVAKRGQSVMPFDLDRSIHRFRPTPTGGVQQVVSKDQDPAQVALIRDHLRREAERFRSGDFSSPTAIHGPEMPGLKTLSAAAGQVRIDYSELPAGAQVVYSADRPELVRALHDWFEAQLGDHGRHAVGH